MLALLIEKTFPPIEFYWHPFNKVIDPISVQLWLVTQVTPTIQKNVPRKLFRS